MENRDGVCPLTMFWQRYYIPPESEDSAADDALLDGVDGHWFGAGATNGEDGKESDGVEEDPPVQVWYSDSVWQVLRLMIEVAYHTRLAPDSSCCNNNNPCFQSTTTRVQFQRCSNVTVEMQHYTVTHDRLLSFNPLFELAGSPATTHEMMRFVIERCRRAKEGEEEEKSDHHPTSHSHSSSYTTTDRDGNTPLHIAVSLNRNSSDRCTNRTMIAILLAYDPTAAQCRNKVGEYPISRAVRAGIPWNDGLELLVKAYPDVLAVEDAMGYGRRGEFLFMAAAVRRGDDEDREEKGEEETLVELDSCYRLLCSYPEGCSMRHRHRD